MSAIKHPEWLHVQSNGKLYFGYDQSWYRIPWRRLAGCGPVSATMQISYINRRDELNLPIVNEGFESVLRSMNLMWRYVTPRIMGLNTLEKYEDGIMHFCRNSNFALEPHKLHVDEKDRPELSETLTFIKDGLDSDTTVSFLNWHNGGINVLDTWHWVSIIAIRDTTIECYDQGNHLSFDIGEWLKKTALGGGFIYFSRK